LAFGTELQQQREHRGISLESIAEATKVPARYLFALEQDELQNLPGGVFNKGIVRSYCQHLGLDEQRWLARLPTTSPDEGSPDWVEFAENVQRNRVPSGAHMGLRWWGVLLMALVLAGAGWVAWQYVVQTKVFKTAHKQMETMPYDSV
jgi:cytoskeleton protein RodZ